MIIEYSLLIQDNGTQHRAMQTDNESVELEEKEVELGEKEAELGEKEAELGRKEAELREKEEELASHLAGQETKYSALEEQNVQLLEEVCVHV